MKVIDRLIEKSCLGSNCSTTALKNILNYYDYNLSEDYIFGLGSGLGFIYQYYANSNEYFLSGKNESVELNAINALGGTIITGSFDDNELAWREVKSYIDQDIPVILDLSIRDLPYFKPYLSNLANIGFGLHNAVLCGYNEKSRTVQLLDHRWSEPLIVSFEDLAKARNSSGNVSSHNAYKVLLISSERKNFSNIRHSILLNINRMKNPFAYKMGLPGISMFKKDINLIIREKNFEDAITTYSYLMERLGTGGGNFRRMYARFLNQVSDNSLNLKYKEIGNSYFDLSKKWRRLSIIMEQMVYNKSLLTEFNEIISEIEFLENEAINNLETLLRRG